MLRGTWRRYRIPFPVTVNAAYHVPATWPACRLRDCLGDNERVTSTSDEPDPTPGPSYIGDALRTTAVLLLIIAFLAGAQRLLSRPQEADPVRPVDYVATWRAAQDVAPFELVAPPELPEGWRATSVRYVPGDDATWHIGVLTDEDKYVGIEQAVGGVEVLVNEYAAESDPDGTVDVGGAEWELLREGDETTLVRDDGGSATLVTGDASQADVELVAGSLSATPPAG